MTTILLLILSIIPITLSANELASIPKNQPLTEEKQQLLEAIKAAGYKTCCNPESLKDMALQTLLKTKRFSQLSLLPELKERLTKMARIDNAITLLSYNKAKRECLPISPLKHVYRVLIIKTFLLPMMKKARIYQLNEMKYLRVKLSFLLEFKAGFLNLPLILSFSWLKEATNWALLTSIQKYLPRFQHIVLETKLA